MRSVSDITAYGANPDGTSDATAAFQKAFAASSSVTIPNGTFAVKELVVPAGKSIRGEGGACIVPTEEAGKNFFKISSGCSLSGIRIDCRGKAVNGIYAFKSSNVSLSNVTIINSKGMGIGLDNSSAIIIQACFISNVRRATDLNFCGDMLIVSNNVYDCTEHGIQFWGNWKFEQQKSSNITIIGNTVRNGGGGAIWGTGASNVLMAYNHVDGAKDVGLDLEWCSDSAIISNTARNTRNACASLFFRCSNVSIAYNDLTNDYPISEKEAAKTWWVRAGIWLTYPNTQKFKNDTGHDNIRIYSNRIIVAEGVRRGMWLGNTSKRIFLQGNTINNEAMKYGDAHGGPVTIPETTNDTTID
ncbi:MAG: right-handed parallel beta-helix repeat-containing protein [Spirochaetes bacterium]|nr:right-handed parallel beta-helix repeat-containing protein [Spirochaetota bacterium]